MSHTSTQSPYTRHQHCDKEHTCNLNNIEYAVNCSNQIPVPKGTSSIFPSFAPAGLTRSFVPKKLIKNAITASTPRTQNVFVHADALSPKYSTSGSVYRLIVNVPAVARRFRKILNTDLSYGSWVINAFSAEYGTLIAV